MDKEREFELTEKEKDLIKDWRDFYESLENGDRVPKTEAQVHFIEVCRGRATAVTEHEIAWMKLKRNRAAAQSKKRIEDDIPDREPGTPDRTWFTDDDWNKLHS